MENTKLSSQTIVNFELRFFDIHNSEFKNMRYGQAFLNTCLPLVTDSRLFYEENLDIARSIVWMEYNEKYHE